MADRARMLLDTLLSRGSYTGVAKDGNGKYNGTVTQGRRADIVIGIPAALSPGERAPANGR